MNSKSSKSMGSDIEIASQARLVPVMELAPSRLGLAADVISPYGHDKAKIPLSTLEGLKKNKDGTLILVTAMTPTKAGEGKTTTSVGLADGLNHIGKNAVVALREPSLGPCFGMKGGAAGGGYAQVVPMADINLHFTGDFHAITSAHMLLSAMVDNHIYWRSAPRIDARRVTWRRVVDMNDRALRSVVTSLGGVGNGFAREDGFDITVASEVMAIFCLATDIKDLEERLGRIIVGYDDDKKPVRAADIKAAGAMTALLRDALQPNLVQTLENNPALIHGGPFANIAHGCNTVLATKTALKLADYVVTEAGFGADLGAEKFFNIKCRKAGLSPKAVVVVATVRALKMHGGVAANDLAKEDIDAVKKGLPNLIRHLENIALFGLPAVVAINRFPTDSEAEIKTVEEACRRAGVQAILAEHWAKGGEGAVNLARAVVSLVEEGKGKFKPLYPDSMSLIDKIRTIVQKIYRGDDIQLHAGVEGRLRSFEEMGYGDVPVCMAKTQYSFSSDAAAFGAPTGFSVPVRDVRLAAGAGFVVALAGDIMTMPGLPRHPAAEQVGVGDDGAIVGLF